MDEITSKLASRKFWICAAAFLGSLGTSIAGISARNETVATVGIICTVASTAIYAAAEAAVDVASVKANTTATLVSTTKATQVTATGKNDEAVGKVANALADEGKAASVPAASPDTSTTEKEA
jgi:hypothetical protein